MVALLVGDTLGICVKRGCILAHWSSDGGRTYKFISASPPMGSNGDSPCLHTTTASVTTWLVEVRKSGFENIGNWKCAFTCFLLHLLRLFKWKKMPSLFVSKYKKRSKRETSEAFLNKDFYHVLTQNVDPNKCRGEIMSQRANKLQRPFLANSIYCSDPLSKMSKTAARYE